MLGADIWAEGEEPDAVWLVTLPGDKSTRKIRHTHNSQADPGRLPGRGHIVSPRSEGSHP